MLVGTDFVGQQVNPSVAMDADGDFAIVWNGQGGEPDRVYPNNEDLVGDVDDRGVFVREYSAGFGATGTTPTAIAPQERVNHTDAGIQEHATIAMEPTATISSSGAVKASATITVSLCVATTRSKTTPARW